MSTYKISTLDEYYGFIKSNTENLRDGSSNCIGTGLFIVGESNKDKYL